MGDSLWRVFLLATGGQEFKVVASNTITYNDLGLYLSDRQPVRLASWKGKLYVVLVDSKCNMFVVKEICAKTGDDEIAVVRDLPLYLKFAGNYVAQVGILRISYDLDTEILI
ncbi:hypothetical protein SELMODRAFT_417777 [Selaginella moellendorffii]|uniref:Uncharacterized protein n=1 Tax=Selaginella moellendorffii TaxID=88036 RepID=D8S3K8_SELML|nr:hypothetical protein SELMODRAFT_417777 [Selaginella moellendorffii]